MRYDDGTNRNGRGRYRNFGRKYSKQILIPKIYSVTEGHNTIYGREVELSMWIGLNCLRLFGSQGIKNIHFSEKFAKFFLLPVNS